jgi:hypothetical protein
VLQSSNVEHGPHALLMHACPFWQLLGPPVAHPPPPLGLHIPDEHVSPEAQSVFCVHVHCMPVCVAVQVALEPHWLFEVHVTQSWPSHTSPALHWAFDVHVVQPPRHSAQTSIGAQFPPWQ